MDMKNLLPAMACAAALFLPCSGRLVAAPATMAMLMPAASPAGKHASAPVRIEGAWVRAAPPGTTMLAGYMDIHNDGKATLRLVSAHADAFGMVELHLSQVVNGMSSMRPAGEQAIPAGGILRIQPGGLHWMLMEPLRPLKPGDTVRFSLRFSDGSEASVIAMVRTGTP